ncbi:MAG: hypothetical protein ABSF45_19810 [Terriglobia bacterium]
MKNIILLIIIACLTGMSTTGTARTGAPATTVESGQPELPAWLQPGTVRFARFDGGPIETQKTRRSAWGQRFTPEDQEVLANLYGKYGDRMVDLLAQANVNFVWVTYSAGFSWEDEAAQRAEIRELTNKLHTRGIKVAAYMCAHSIFWESLFKDVPQSVKWLQFDSEGIPFRYSGGRDPLRFIADLDNPAWVEYQKRRVGGIIDDGLDAIFFDNTADPHWSSNESVTAFLAKIRVFARQEKKSNIPLFTNFGLSPSRAVLNQFMDFLYDEGWVEPGVWDKDWVVANVRRDRFVEGLNSPWKPLITEYSKFHSGDRASTFLSARSQRLGIGEAAAFGAAYTWDMEGPFDKALITRDAAAVDSWGAISQYNRFLADHRSLFLDAVNVAPYIVLLPDNLQTGFAWRDSVPRLDFLARNSLLYDLKLASRVTSNDLARYQGVIVPSYASLSAEQKAMIHEYKAAGRKVYMFAERSETEGLDAEIYSPEAEISSAGSEAMEGQVRAEVRALAPNATRVEIETAGHVLANVTSVQSGNVLAVHLLNYDPTPSGGLELRLALGKDFQKLTGHKPTLISPDAKPPVIEKQEKGSMLQIALPSLDVYSVLVLQ